MKKGFTLLEILLAVAAIGILASIVIIAINPGKQLATARNTKRQSDVAAIANAIYQYSVDHDGVYPPGLSTSSTQMLGTAASGCTVMCGALVTTSGGGGGNPGNIPYSFTDSTASVFNQGSYTNTWFNTTNGGIELANPSAAPSGTFLSAVKDSGSSQTTWSTVSWVPEFPSNKALPDFGQSENGYANGNISMAGNLLLMHLDEPAGATSFTDTSGNNSNGTCGSACPTLGVAGTFGTAASLDGLKSDIYVPDTAALEYTGGTFTLGAWVYLNGTETTGGNIFSKPWNGSGQYNYRLFFNTNRTIGLNLVGATAYTLTGPTTAVIPQNAWAYVAATIDSTGLAKLYLNGALVTSGTSTIVSWIPPAGNLKSALVIGGLFPYATSWAGNTGMVVDGKIDEASIYSRVLSAGEILDRYKRGGERLRLQVRSCPSASCSSGTFVGPDGTANSYFTDSSSNATLSPQTTANLSGVPNNEYFQYKVFLDSTSATYSPGVKQITVTGSFPPANADAVTGVSASSTLTDSGSTAFNQGTYASTIFNVPNTSVELTNPANAQSGTYTSAIRDSGSTQSSWVNISFVPERPTAKELPNYNQSEYGYVSGNANMNGNTGLWHLDEAQGSTLLADSSGSGNAGSCSGAFCPTMNSSAVFNNAAWFTQSAKQAIVVPNSASINTGSGDFTISAFLNIPSGLVTGGNYDVLSKTANAFNGNGNGWQFRIRPPNSQFCIGSGSGGCKVIAPSVSAYYNKWTLFTVSVSRAANTASVYFNGQLAGTTTAPTFIDTYPLQIGNGYDSYYTGGIDEVSLWNRALSQSEILDLYKRSQYSVNVQVRSCSDPTCSANPAFVGPDGTSGSYFTDASNQSATTPTNLPLVGVANNEYFQYKLFFNTSNTTLTPGIHSVSAGYNPQGGAAPVSTSTSTTSTVPVSTSGPVPTADACLDLTSSLVSDYISALPIDTKYGSSAKTYYAVGEDANGGLTVTACGSENGTLIQTKL